MGFAPTHQLLAAETRIGAQDDSYFRPHRSPLRYDSFDLLPATCRSIAVRGPQTRTQQMLTGKNVEWQIAVVVVIAMEEAVLAGARAAPHPWCRDRECLLPEPGPALPA